MSLTDETYFIGDIDLPHNAAAISSFINKYETEYLRMMLGIDLSAAVSQYDSIASPQVIIDLVEGVNFMIRDKNVRWNGLINIEKVSPISYYVFYQYVRSLATDLRNVGTVTSKQENSTVASPNRILIDAWNDMVGLTCGKTIGGYVSLVAFLREKNESYPEWSSDDFIDLEYQNILGI